MKLIMQVYVRQKHSHTYIMEAASPHSHVYNIHMYLLSECVSAVSLLVPSRAEDTLQLALS